MARTKRKRNGQFTSGGRPGATNIVIRDTVGVPVRASSRGSRGGRRRRRGGGGGGGSIVDDLVAGAAFGLIERVAESQGFPTIPLLGRKGTITVAAYLLRKQHPMIAKAARAGAILSSYQLVAEGRISGEDDDGFGGTV